MGLFPFRFVFPLVVLAACCGINDSWEVKGGGYVKYSVGGESSRTIELDVDDVEIPYINNSHHYFFFRTRAEASDRGDQLSLMIAKPVLGDNRPVQGQYSWFVSEYSEKGSILSEKSVIHFDERDDSTWTADLDLYAVDCRSGNCLDSVENLHITGRFRYWIPEDER